MSAPDPPGWSPLPHETHETQAHELSEIARAFPTPPRVLDLGAGNGRLACPLAAIGCHVTAVDTDPRACAAVRDAGIDTIQWDFTAHDDPTPPIPDNAFDLAVCAGNTFCLLHHPDEAIRLVRRIRDWLDERGILAIDELVTDTWQSVADGDWQAGISETGDQQLLWSRGDNVIAVREADRVDENDWEINEHDTPMRLWSTGELTLLARAAGISGPRTSPLGSLILFS